MEYFIYIVGVVHIYIYNTPQFKKSSSYSCSCSLVTELGPRKFISPHPASSASGEKKPERSRGVFIERSAQPSLEFSPFLHPLTTLSGIRRPVRSDSTRFLFFRRHWPRHGKETARIMGWLEGKTRGGWIVKYWPDRRAPPTAFSSDDDDDDDDYHVENVRFSPSFSSH